MDYIKQIVDYIPANEQEEQDKRLMLQYIAQNPENILLRSNETAHLTSSGFIMNKTLDKVLLAHHNLRNAWAWTGGHTDGDGDFLHVALKEAMEETGIKDVVPLSREIASLDILPVYGHMKKGQYVSAHVHLSVAYILIASEEEQLVVKKDENSGVSWFGIEKFTSDYFDHNDVYLYNKLIHKARELGKRLQIIND